MRICVLVPRAPAASETFITDHIDGARARGHDVVVVAMKEPTTATGTLRLLAGNLVRRRWGVLRYALHHVERRPREVPPRLGCIDRLAAAAPFDVLHAQFGDSGVAALNMRDAGVFDAPIVTSFHGHDANVRPRVNPSLYDRLMRSGLTVTVGSVFMRDVVVGLGFPAELVAPWRQGVDASRFAAAHPMATAQRFRVITVGRLIPVKGIDVALRAIAAARPQIAGLEYVVVGDGVLRPDLERLACELGVDDITTFAGERPHDWVGAALADADAFLLTGRTDAQGSTEGQGVAALEAAGAGLPVVVSRSGGLPEAVIDGQTGFVVSPEDAVAAAAALARLATETGLAQCLGEAGRAHVAGSFSRSHSLDQIEQVYRDCLATQ